MVLYVRIVTRSQETLLAVEQFYKWVDVFRREVLEELLVLYVVTVARIDV